LAQQLDGVKYSRSVLTHITMLGASWLKSLQPISARSTSELSRRSARPQCSACQSPVDCGRAPWPACASTGDDSTLPIFARGKTHRRFPLGCSSPKSERQTPINAGYPPMPVRVFLFGCRLGKRIPAALLERSFSPAGAREKCFASRGCHDRRIWLRHGLRLYQRSQSRVYTNDSPSHSRRGLSRPRSRTPALLVPPFPHPPPSHNSVGCTSGGDGLTNWLPERLDRTMA